MSGPFDNICDRGSANRLEKMCRQQGIYFPSSVLSEVLDSEIQANI